VQPQDIAAAIWPGRPLALEPLGGGITNRNFKVALDGDVFVLRIGGKDTDLLGIDRQAEYEASLAAASLGIGPEVVGFLEREGCLVTRFIAGDPVDARTPGMLGQVGRTLRRLHDGPSIPGRFDAFRVVEAYCATAAARRVRIPALFAWAKGLADEIERSLGSRPRRPCHNDLLNANFIHDGERLRIVDWEYAGMGDPCFDLANFAVNHELLDDEQRELLLAYADEVRERDLGALRLLRFMSDFREAMWGVVQQGISELDFDFVAYANEHFERLQRTAAESSFHEARETLAR
jgi:thiamine kinase-like enzyme